MADGDHDGTTAAGRARRGRRERDASKERGWSWRGSMDDLRTEGVLTVSGASGGVRHAVAVFLHEGRVYALDNRCPHMGFPLSRGSCSEGIVICYWHYARFDLASGGTFDPFADDVRTYPVEVREGEVWVDLRGAADTPQQRAAERRRWMERLDDGMEQSIPLVQSKAVLQLLDLGTPVPEIVERAARFPLRFGSRRNARGWGDGLTILTAMANIMDDVGQEERSLALYHGIRRAVEDTSARVERVQLDPLPGPAGAERGAIPVERLKAWFRQFIEVRHAGRRRARAAHGDRRGGHAGAAGGHAGGGLDRPLLPRLLARDGHGGQAVRAARPDRMGGRPAGAAGGGQPAGDAARGRRRATPGTTRSTWWR